MRLDLDKANATSARTSVNVVLSLVKGAKRIGNGGKQAAAQRKRIRYNADPAIPAASDLWNLETTA